MGGTRTSALDWYSIYWNKDAANNPLICTACLVEFSPYLKEKNKSAQNMSSQTVCNHQAWGNFSCHLLWVRQKMDACCLCTHSHRSNASHMSFERVKTSLFIILFLAITSEKDWVTYDNEPFDPHWSSVYWWVIVQPQTQVNNPKAS